MAIKGAIALLCNYTAFDNYVMKSICSSRDHIPANAINFISIEKLKLVVEQMQFCVEKFRF